MRLQIAFARALHVPAAAHFRAGYGSVEATSTTEADLQGRSRGTANPCSPRLCRGVSAGIRKMNLSLGAGGASDLSVLCEDGERVLCRGWRDDGDGARTAVLAVVSAFGRPSTQDSSCSRRAPTDSCTIGSSRRLIL
jgi:hypothetical protein